MRQVSIAILTFRRTDELRRAIHSVIAVAVPPPGSNWALKEILVVDNNPDGAAEPVISAIKAETGSDISAKIKYVNETTPGIVAGRNRALLEATGNVLVFIDDDEIALDGWPNGLLRVMDQTGAAMVGGPVNFEFVSPPEAWVIESGLFSHANPPDGTPQDWLRTGNLAIDLPAVRAAGLTFDDRYPHGEDGMFSRLAKSKGLGLSWSSTAPVLEYVEPGRTTLAWRRRRDRISTDAWVRTELDIDSSYRTKLRIVVRTGYRYLQGLSAVIFGTLGRSMAKRNTGLALVSQARADLRDSCITTASDGPSLPGDRHQFCARWKAAGCPKFE